MAPRDRGADGVPLEADWPDLDAASHRLRVDHDTLRETAAKLAGQLETYRQGRGSPSDLAGTPSLDAAWGGWESASPVAAAAGEAMRHVVEAYRLLLADYEAAGDLLLRTAHNYAAAEAGTNPAVGATGRDPTAGRW